MVQDTEHHVGGLAICPHCLKRLPYVLPVEPLYDITLAAQLIPMSREAMRQYLHKHRHEFERRYRRDKQKRLHRMVTAGEIRLIRSRILRFKDVTGKKKREMSIEGN